MRHTKTNSETKIEPLVHEWFHNLLRSVLLSRCRLFQNKTKIAFEFVNTVKHGHTKVVDNGGKPLCDSHQLLLLAIAKLFSFHFISASNWPLYCILCIVLYTIFVRRSCIKL